jgi:sulfoxide reductase heme-binding subunit YedZ
MNQKRAILGLKVVLWICALTPAAWLGAAFYFDAYAANPVAKVSLGANPIEKLTHVTGMTTLVLLLITLSVTPVRRLTGWNRVIKLRRTLGLFAFFYAFLHFSIWSGLDQTFVWAWMIEDVIERPYITVGFAGFIILIPLAITSTKGWIRQLGTRWTVLHRGVYLTATLGVIHFYWLVKADVRLPLFLGACLVLLLSWRVVFSIRKSRRVSPRKDTAPATP